MSSGTGKYEILLERCARLDPVPTAVAHPCEKTALAGALEAGAEGPDHPDSGRSRSQNPGGGGLCRA